MVKYCQECGNASYDSAPICGNCGAKFPPKSKDNSKPPKINKTNATTQKNSIFSNKTRGFSNNLSEKLNNIDLNKYSNTAKEKKARKEKQQIASKKFNKTATEGFKEKYVGTKNPATKFNNPKKEKDTKIITPTKVKTKEVKEKDTEPNIFKKSESSSSNFNFKKVGIIALIIIIILIIAGIGINGIQNQPTDKVEHYTDGTISFDYSGNWSMYNNNDKNSSSDIAFKTKENTLIGFTTIQSNEITYDKILSDINATANSLNGSIVEYHNIEINGIPSLEITISTQNQGYSRYICILHDNVYYSFVINNGKSTNSDISAVTTPEIQNMINSISFVNSVNTNTTN